MTRPLTHCSIDHVLRAWPFAPAYDDRVSLCSSPLRSRYLGEIAERQRRSRRACTGWAGRAGAPLRLIAPMLELPTCPRCQVLWDLDQELRQEVTP